MRSCVKRARAGNQQQGRPGVCSVLLDQLQDAAGMSASPFIGVCTDGPNREGLQDSGSNPDQMGHKPNEGDKPAFLKSTVRLAQGRREHKRETFRHGFLLVIPENTVSKRNGLRPLLFPDKFIFSHIIVLLASWLIQLLTSVYQRVAFN
ncbi:hypothetical protein ABNB88_07620 [Paenibacillus larvae]